MDIKHIILPGGGPLGIYVYGILKRLNNLKFWQIENIKSIYCTSIGGLIGIIIALNLDWEWMDDFIIKRPWHKTLDLNNINYLKIIGEKGFFDESIAKNIIEPLLKSKNINTEINLKDFYNLTNIKLYFYSTNINLNLLNEQEISYINYPNMKLYEALYATMNIPFIFKPFYIDDKCFIDGGLVNNNPIKNCIENEKCDTKNILFFTNSTKCKENKLDKDSNIFDLLLLLLSKMATTIMCRDIDIINNFNIYNTIYCDLNNGSLNLEFWLKVLNNREERQNILDKGIIDANKFLTNKYSYLFNKIGNDSSLNIINYNLLNITNDNSLNITNDNIDISYLY